MVAPVAALGVGLGTLIAKFIGSKRAAARTDKVVEAARQSDVPFAQMTRPQLIAELREQGKVGEQTGRTMSDVPLLNALLGEEQGRLKDERSAVRGIEQQAQVAFEARQQERQNIANELRKEREMRTGQLQDDLKGPVAAQTQAAASLRGALNAPEDFAGDEIRMFSFARSLQPTGILTDEDVKRGGGSGALPSQVQRYFDLLSTGNKLTPQDRAGLERAMMGMFRQNQEGRRMAMSPFLFTAERLGINPDEIVNSNIFIGDEELAPFDARIRGVLQDPTIAPPVRSNDGSTPTARFINPADVDPNTPVVDLRGR